MTTRARDFKFTGAIVQRLQLVMVALTQNFFSAHYAWFPRGGSHIIIDTQVCNNANAIPTQSRHAGTYAVTIAKLDGMDRRSRTGL